jgi:SAM-dependent methyltransferase
MTSFARSRLTAGSHQVTTVSPELDSSSLAQFTVERDDVWIAMRPFVSGVYDQRDPTWIALVDKQRRRIRSDRMRGLLRYFGLKASRGQKEIERVYSERWNADRFMPFAIPQVPKGGTPHEWEGRGLRLANAGARRVRILYMMRLIEILTPRSVLEIGFGEGVNLALLAARFPNVEFGGIELTEGGLEAARSLQEIAELPTELVAFSPEPPMSLDAHRSIKYRRGSAAKLPLPDASFDLVFTSLALEQMEEIRTDALSEIARVAQRHVVMIEPFTEVNSHGLRRKYIATYDYFRGAIADLPSYGLEPLLVSEDIPGKVTLKAALVVCEKREPQVASSADRSAAGQ